jgi:protein-S-isoprenylcysteine O-methyltransferase Ste14
MLLLRSIFFTFLLPGTVAVLIPYFLVASPSEAASGAVRFLGMPLMACGAIGLIWSIWQFFAEGRGTLAPIDPPKELVILGLYRVVRNPMYVSVAAILIGEAIFFGSLAVLIEAAVFVVVTHLFIIFYEEPHLRTQFGASYDKYTRAVHRWLPRWPPNLSDVDS